MFTINDHDSVKIKNDKAAINELLNFSREQPFYFEAPLGVDVKELNSALSELSKCTEQDYLDRAKEYYQAIINILASDKFVTPGGNKSLHYPAFGYFLLTRDLIAAGAQINVLDRNGNTPLCLAFARKKKGNGILSNRELEIEQENTALQIVKLLMQNGASIGEYDIAEPHRSALALAVDSGFAECVTFMLDFTNLKRQQNNQPNYQIEPGIFELAMKNNPTKTVPILLNAGFLLSQCFIVYEIETELYCPQFDARWTYSQEITCNAIGYLVRLMDESDAIELLPIFLDHRADINSKDSQGVSAFARACQTKKDVLVERMILTRGTKATPDGDEFVWWFRCMYEQQQPSMLIYLIEKPDANLRVKITEDGWTLMHIAVAKQNLDLVQKLIAYDAPLDERLSGGPQAGLTPLDLAKELHASYIVTELNYAIYKRDNKLNTSSTTSFINPYREIKKNEYEVATAIKAAAIEESQRIVSILKPEDTENKYKPQ